MRNVALALLCAMTFATPLFAQAPKATPQLQERPRYRLHPGDTVVLNYRLTPDFDQDATVGPDGYLNLKVGGSVHVGGMTLEEAHDAIVTKAGEKLNEPELAITLKDIVLPYVIVAGEVTKPGKLELRENTTALQAILMSGGFGENARAGQVVLIRKVNDTEGEVHLLTLSHVHKTKDL